MKPWKYVGGGYWRDSSVPKGEVAETLHGEEIVRAVLEEAANAVREGRLAAEDALDPKFSLSPRDREVFSAIAAALGLAEDRIRALGED
jgi:NADPH-dependent 2,4-dienoyl-CoA reductase/sulfur reductase-like enzyme